MDFRHDGSSTFVDLNDVELWRSNRCSRSNLQVIITNDQIKIFPGRVKPEPIGEQASYSPAVCTIQQRKPFLLRRPFPADLGMLFTFGHHDNGLTWLDSLDEVAHSGRAFLEGGTKREGDRQVRWVRETMPKESDGAVYEYGFYPEHGYLPAWYRHYIKGSLTLKQSWVWEQSGNVFLPKEYEMSSPTLDEGAEYGVRWRFRNQPVDTKTFSSRFELADFDFRLHDQIHDQTTDTWSEFDGSEIREIETPSGASEESNFGGSLPDILLRALAALGILTAFGYFLRYQTKPQGFRRV
ncbi:MAG: hypothetical protein AAF989_16245 [Planctomycetota bacterium]